MPLVAQTVDVLAPGRHQLVYMFLIGVSITSLEKGLLWLTLILRFIVGTGMRWAQ